MNGAQFVWLVFAVGFAWIVFQRACGEARSRAERIRVARSIADKSAGPNVKLAKLHGAINPAELRMRIYKMERDFARLEIELERIRTATIAQARYWP